MRITIDFKSQKDLLNFHVIDKITPGRNDSTLDPIQHWISCVMPSKSHSGDVDTTVTDWFFSVSAGHCLRDSNKWKNNGSYTPFSMWRELITFNT